MDVSSYSSWTYLYCLTILHVAVSNAKSAYLVISRYALRFETYHILGTVCSMNWVKFLSYPDAMEMRQIWNPKNTMWVGSTIWPTDLVSRLP